LDGNDYIDRDERDPDPHCVPPIYWQALRLQLLKLKPDHGLRHTFGQFFQTVTRASLRSPTLYLLLSYETTLTPVNFGW